MKPDHNLKLLRNRFDELTNQMLADDESVIEISSAMAWSLAEFMSDNLTDWDGKFIDKFVATFRGQIKRKSH